MGVVSVYSYPGVFKRETVFTENALGLPCPAFCGPSDRIAPQKPNCPSGPFEVTNVIQILVI